MKIEIYCKGSEFLKEAFHVDELTSGCTAVLEDGTEVRVSRSTSFRDAGLTLIELTLSFGTGVVSGVISNWLYARVLNALNKDRHSSEPIIKEIRIEKKRIVHLEAEHFRELIEETITKEIRTSVGSKR